MKSLVMTSGEIEYEQVFRFRDFQEAGTDNPPVGDLNYVAMTHILFVVFVILMPILFANLLVSIAKQIPSWHVNLLFIQIGLAVGDTQKVEERATLTYLSLQVMHS